MGLSSVIIFQIDIDGLAFDPAERNAPVSTGVDRVTTLIATDECMKAEARQIHVLRTRGVIQSSQNIRYPTHILHAEPAPVSGREKPFERLVPERADHPHNVKQTLTYVKQRFTSDFRISAGGFSEM
jgi:hypothetical protein